MGAHMAGMPATPGAPGIIQPGGAAPAAAPAASSRAKNFVDLRQFIPASLSQAAGIHLGRVKSGGSELSDQLRTIMTPVIDVGVRAGMKPEDIELAFAGADKERKSVLVCLKSKARLSESAIVKALSAEEQGEKIGKSTVHKLPAVPGYENAMAVIDGDTLLVGRKPLVEEALRNPKEGPVRNGLDSIDLKNTLFFIAGASLGEQAMSKNGMRLLATVAESKGTPSSGMAMAIISSGQSPTGQASGFSGDTDPTMMAAGMPAGHGAPSGPPASHGSGPADPAAAAAPGIHSAAAPGIHGAGSPGASASPGTGTGSSTNSSLAGTVDVVVGMNFSTEASAREVERRLVNSRKSLDDLQKLIIDALNKSRQGSGANPAGAAPGAPGVPGSPAGMGHAAPGNLSVRSMNSPHPAPHPADFAPIDLDTHRRFDPFARGLLESYAQQPGGSPSGPPGVHGAGPANPGVGMPADPAAMGATTGISGGNSTGNAVGDARIAFELAFAATREGSIVRLSGKLESQSLRNQLGRLGDALGASGVTAIDDGVYSGTLARLHNPFNTWITDSSKAELHKGLRRIGNLPVRAGYSWMTEMLPFTGHEDTYLKFNFDKSWSDAENIEFTKQVVPQFLNPGDARQQLRGGPYDGQGATHFVGVSGVEDNRNDVAASWPRTDPRAGVFGYDGIAKPEQITDGQSNTIMLIGSGQVIGGWVHGGGATVRGARAPYFDSTTGFGSRGIEGSGTYVLMSDGSTRVISASIDAKLFRALCTTHGAEQVDPAGIPAPTPAVKPTEPDSKPAEGDKPAGK